MEVLVVEGEKYVKASSIARDLGYTSDYVGQLCRGGKVEAQLVGRSWYVKEDSIKSHKATRYRSTKKSTQKAIKNTPQNATQTTKSFEAKLASYEADATELMPLTGQSVALETDDRSLDVPLHLESGEESKPAASKAEYQEVVTQAEAAVPETNVLVSHSPTKTVFKPSERTLPPFKGKIKIEEVAEEDLSEPEMEAAIAEPEAEEIESLELKQPAIESKKSPSADTTPPSKGSIQVAALDSKTVAELPIVSSSLRITQEIPLLQIGLAALCIVGVAGLVSIVLIEQSLSYRGGVTSAAYSINVDVVLNKLLK